MDHGEAAFEGGVEGVFGGALFGRCAGLDERFGVFDVDVAELGVPVLVDDGCCLRELAVGQCLVDLFGCNGEFVEYPAFC